MVEHILSVPIIELTYDELVDVEQKLVDLARRSVSNSYAPYSNFHVGAAISLDNGEIIVGANQENAAFTSGICAERTACFYAHTRYPDAKFTAIAIAARDCNNKEVINPISPCGHCRQALLEYEKMAGTDVRVIMVGAEKIFIASSVRSLLPFAFTEF